MRRQELVDKIFKHNLYFIRTTQVKFTEASLVGEEEIDVSPSMGQSGVNLDPSGGFFDTDRDLDHEDLLVSILSGAPRTLAMREFEETSLDMQILYSASINVMVEHVNINGDLLLCNPDDAPEILSIVTEYIKYVEYDMEMSVNDVGIPAEDLDKLVAFQAIITMLVDALNYESSQKELGTGLRGRFMATGGGGGLTSPVRFIEGGGVQLTQTANADSEEGFSTLPPGVMLEF